MLSLDERLLEEVRRNGSFRKPAVADDDSPSYPTIEPFLDRTDLSRPDHLEQLRRQQHLTWWAVDDFGRPIATESNEPRVRFVW